MLLGPFGEGLYKTVAKRSLHSGDHLKRDSDKFQVENVGTPQSFLFKALLDAHSWDHLWANYGELKEVVLTSTHCWDYSQNRLEFEFALQSSAASSNTSRGRDMSGCKKLWSPFGSPKF